MPDCLGLSRLFRVGAPLGLSLLCPRNVLGGGGGGRHMVQGGRGTRHEPQAPEEALHHRRDVKQTGATWSGQKSERSLPRTSRRGGPARPGPWGRGRATSRLGSVAAVGGHAAGWRGGGFWCLAAGIPCPPRDCGTAWGPFSSPTSGHRKCRTGALNGRAPRSGTSSSSSSPHAFPESRWPQAEEYKFRAGLAEPGRRGADRKWWLS